MLSDDTIRARAVWRLHRQGAYLPNHGERVDDVAAYAGEARDIAHAERIIRQMAETTTSPVAYKRNTGETLVGLRVETFSEVLYWMNRYDASELPSGMF